MKDWPARVIGLVPSGVATVEVAAGAVRRFADIFDREVFSPVRNTVVVDRVPVPSKYAVLITSTRLGIPEDA